MTDGIKRIVAHRAECWYRDDPMPDRFYVEGPTLYRDKIGRKGSTMHSWRTYLCNDPACPGTVAVRWDVLRNFIAEALRTPSRGSRRPG